MNTHPAAATARAFINGMSAEDREHWLDALAEVACNGDENARRCFDTLTSACPSDLDVLGLAWTLRMCFEMGGYPQ